MATQHSYGKTVTSGLVLYLNAADRNSYPGTGTAWSDLSGNGNNGALTNGPTFNSANGGSIVFDGNDDYLTCSRPINSSDSYTINLFTKLNVPITTCNMFNINDGVNSIALCYFYPAGNGLIFRSRDNTRYILSNPITVTNWHFYTFTWNGVSTAIYVDGVSNSQTTADTLGNVLVDAFQISKGLISPPTHNGYYANMSVSNCSIYNRALSATEVLQNYNATKSRFGLR